MRRIPAIPFPSYKWLFATKAPTEALGDPAVLLGLISRLAKIEDGINKYNSDAFSEVLIALDNDIKTSVDLSRRVGERNLMRNSAQYWKLFGLIPAASTGGVITLTPLARQIAFGEVSQIEFAASMIITLQLPNATSYSRSEIDLWKRHNLVIHPLKLILQIVRELYLHGQGRISVDELATIVVPMAAEKLPPEDIANEIIEYRENPSSYSDWPNCTPRSNDKRFLGEFLRFLANFGYLSVDFSSKETRGVRTYEYIEELDYQIQELIDGRWSENASNLVEMIRKSDLSSSIVQSGISRRSIRPGQQRFRSDILSSIGYCPITGVDLPTVLQAAHIKPYSFGGSQDADNGLPLRADIHCLFDNGLLNIKPVADRLCSIELANDQVRSNYRELQGKFFELPAVTNIDYVKWRYDNHLLGVV